MCVCMYIKNGTHTNVHKYNNDIGRISLHNKCDYITLQKNFFFWCCLSNHIHSLSRLDFYSWQKPSVSSMANVNFSTS